MTVQTSCLSYTRETRILTQSKQNIQSCRPWSSSCRLKNQNRKDVHMQDNHKKFLTLNSPPRASAGLFWPALDIHRQMQRKLVAGLKNVPKNRSYSVTISQVIHGKLLKQTHRN